MTDPAPPIMPSLADVVGAAKARLVNTPELKEQRNATVLYVFGL